MSDSCGILFVDLPGVYTLNKNLADIHERDPIGVLKWVYSVGEDGADVEDGVEEVSPPPPTPQLRYRATTPTKVKTTHANGTEALAA